MTTTDVILPRSPGSLCLNSETGVAGCIKCGWRGVARPDEHGGTDRRCPSCEIAPETDAEYAALCRPQAPKVGRNEPCPCGSGKKFKKCCGR